MPLFANDLNCAFTQYLEEASSSSKGVKAAFATAMLADMSYANSDHSDTVHLREWMGILIKGGYETTLAEVTNLCEVCSLSADCMVSGVIFSD